MVTGDILHRNCADEKRAGILSEPLVEVEEREGEAPQPEEQDHAKDEAKARSRVREQNLLPTSTEAYLTYRVTH